MGDSNAELLFFDTFSHENTEDLNLDLVQFPRPVLLHEIRVIPLGTKVYADVPGGARMGATNPSSFNLELFVNDLNLRDASTFVKLGMLDYKENVDIQLPIEKKLPTDGLILKGWYTTITVAVYGCPTTVVRERASPPPPPPPTQAPNIPTVHAVPQPGVQMPQPVEFPVNQPLPPVIAERPVMDFTHLPPPPVQTHLPPPPIHTQPPPMNPPTPRLEPIPAMNSIAPPPHRDVIPPPQAHPLPPVSGMVPLPVPPVRDFDPRVAPPDIRSPPPGAHDMHRDRHQESGELYDDKRDGRDQFHRDHPQDHEQLHGPERDDGMDIRERDQYRPRRDIDFDTRERGKPRTPPPRSRSPSPRSRSPVSRGSSRSREPDEPPEPNIQEPSGPIHPPPPPDDLFDPLTPDHSPTEDEKIYTGMLSDGEIPENEGNGYEIISSEEEMFSEDELPIRDVQEVPGEIDPSDDAWSYAISSFNPYQCDLAPLETYTDPSLSVFELERNKLIQAKSRESVEVPEAAEQLEQIVEMYRTTEHQDKWIEAMESVPGLLIPGLIHLLYKQEKNGVLDSLIDWTFEGLNLSLAMQQPSPAYKLRHIKMGINLANAMCNTEPRILSKMLTRGVQERLLDLYETPHMSLSIQIQIIRALDKSTRFKDGLDWFLGQHAEQTGSDESKPAEKIQKTPYQRVAKVFMKKQMVRASAAMAALVRKIHVFEMMCKLQVAAQQISEVVNLTEREQSQQATVSEDAEQPMETDEDMAMFDSITEDDMEMIIACVEEITKVVAVPNDTIAQPQRSLPTQAQFSISKPPMNPMPNLYHMMYSTQVLETMFILLSCPDTSSVPDVFVVVRDFLEQCLTTQSGLLFLTCRSETINGIIRCLTQNSDYGRDEGLEDNSCQQLGLSLIYHLHTLQLIDQLKEYHAKESSTKDVDDAEVVGVLHSLYLMTFTPQGRDSVVAVLSMQDTLDVLLPFVEFSGDEEKDGRMRRSVCLSYTFLLILRVIQNLKSMEMLERFGSKLLAISDQDIGGKMVERSAELQDWLAPLRKVMIFDLDNLEDIIKQLKHYSDDINELPKGLITTLRILQHMAISPSSCAKVKPEGKSEELKYKYTQLELYSSDCVNIIITIIQKLSNLMLQPWQQGLPQTSVQARLVVSTVQPALLLLRAMVTQVIQARSEQFQDISNLQALLSLHTILCSVSPAGVLSPEVQQIQNVLVDIVLAYTQPPLKTDDSEDALKTSLWTKMLKELLKYTLSSPHTFLSGLILVSEIMPLPLPIQTREPLTEEEVTIAVNHRKLWSAHLLAVSPEIQEVIKTLSGSACQPLQQLLRRVCWQLADLASPTAVLVVKCLIDTLTESMDTTTESYQVAGEKKEENREGEKVREEKRSSGQTARILNLIAFLMNQAPIKAAFISISKGGEKLGEKYGEIMGRLATLLNIVSERSTHVQAQESIVSIFQSLCDLDVTLVTCETSNSLQDQLANTLPCQEQLSTLCHGLLEHVGQQDHSYSSVLPSLRTLTLFMDHDYGFHIFKCALEKQALAFFNLFTRINNTFSKDSSDCIATLSSAAMCVQFMMTLVQPLEGGDLLPDRKMALTTQELRQVLNWSPDVTPHPLDDIEKLLHEYAKEEEQLKPVHEAIYSLISDHLKQDESAPRPEIPEPTLPPAESLSTQFNQRATYLIVDTEDNSLSPTYWLAPQLGEESDQEQEMVRLDFDEMAEKYCPGFDLQSELHKGSVPSEPAVLRPHKRIRTMRTRHDMINTSRQRGGRRGFVAPMRGRGFQRNVAGSRTDHFRSRAPNTSRPPSMHVDDFVKMESQPPVGGQGNMQPMQRRMDKDMGRGQDMGRGRGFNDRGRGRFFSPPGAYGRRDQGPHGGHGRGMAGNRGGMQMRGGPPMNRGAMSNRGSPSVRGASPWGQRTPRGGGFGGSKGFGRGGHDGRVMSADRRGGREGGAGPRFSRGGGRGNWMGNKPKEQDRGYMGPPGGGFRGRRDPMRHQRSFTK